MPPFGAAFIVELNFTTFSTNLFYCRVKLCQDEVVTDATMLFVEDEGVGDIERVNSRPMREGWHSFLRAVPALIRLAR